MSTLFLNFIQKICWLTIDVLQKKKEKTAKPSCVTVKLKHNKQTQKGDISHEHCNTSIVNQHSEVF